MSSDFNFINQHPECVKKGSNWAFGRQIDRIHKRAFLMEITTSHPDLLRLDGVIKMAKTSSVTYCPKLFT